MGAGLGIFAQPWKKQLNKHLEGALNFVPVRMELVSLQLKYIINTEVAEINQYWRN